MAFFVVIFVLTIVTLAAAQVPFLGDCPKLNPMQDFNMTKYMGKWYEAERYFQIYQIGEKCVSQEYKDNGNEIKVISRQRSALTGSDSEIEGKITLVKNGLSSEMFFRYPYFPMDLPFWILDTDYDNYAVAWSCSSMRMASIRHAWILTRERLPSIGVMEDAYSVLDANGITRGFLYRTDQTNCPDDKVHSNSFNSTTPEEASARPLEGPTSTMNNSISN